MRKFKGLYPALITPFHEDGTIDGDVVQKLVMANLEKGVDGFYVSGSTGESYMLSMDERKYLLEAVAEAVGNRADIIVNIGMFATEHSLALARHAETCGVSAVSSVPPFYFLFNREEYQVYYDDLAKGVDLPVIVYNIPAMSSVHFTTEELEQLLENDKIAGIKHTSYDTFQLQRLAADYPGKSIFIGHDEIYLSALAVGVEAGIGTTYNIMAEKFVRMNQLFREQRMGEALEIQNEVNEVITALLKVGIFKGVKEILKLQGYDCGVCRRPFLPLDEKQKAYLHETAEAHHLI